LLTFCANVGPSAEILYNSLFDKQLTLFSAFLAAQWME